MAENLVGLIPAAGVAKRVSPLPGSKELFPIGFREVQVDGGIQLRPKVVSQYLLDSMFLAGARKVWMVLGKGKADILQYYGDGLEFGGRIAYLVMDKLWGMPYTLDQAWPWLNRNTVLFGMPDTIFAPQTAFVHVLERHHQTGADVTLGVFPTERPERLCPVTFDVSFHVQSMTDKPSHSELLNTWGCACWSPRFTDFMHEYLAPTENPAREVVLADVFRAALQEGLPMRCVHFQDGEYIDIGTPEDLVLAVHRFSQS